MTLAAAEPATALPAIEKRHRDQRHYPHGIAFMDGQYLPMSEAKISVLDWGFLHSDATYDTVHVWDGRFFRLDLHLDRFCRGMEKLRMKVPYSRCEIEKILSTCVALSGHKSAYVEMICTRGGSPTFSRDPREAENRFIAFAVPFGSVANKEQLERGLHVAISSTVRIPPKSIDSTIKNYHWLDLIKGLFDAYDYGAETALIVDINGNIAEGPGFNVFTVKGGRLKTPAYGVLTGITRQTVFDLCGELSLSVSAGDIDRDELKGSDEVFITSTAGGIMPVSKINETVVGDGKVGALTRQLTDLYWEKHADPAWSTAVNYASYRDILSSVPPSRGEGCAAVSLPMTSAFISYLSNELAGLKSAGLYKSERVIASTQSAEIVVGGEKVLNFCANNYLGLADSADLRAAASRALDRYGYGMASVRFICGTQEEHKQLEATISSFLGLEDTILYGSCFDANGGLFETLLGDDDAIISDALNHASIIDGVRLSKAKRFRYANNDMADLEARLKEAKDCRFRLIATDGVFSMDGIIANLRGVCDLADKYDAMVMVDDSHAVGFVGKNGRGSAEHCGVEGRVDIITGTLGKALGGASGGYTSGRKQVVDWLRQRSRPYLFSNTLMPAIAGASIKVFELVRNGDALRERLNANAARFRSQMGKLGFTLAGADHPIIPVMLGDATLAQEMAARMLKRGIYVIGFSFPVVPKGQARIRTQMSAAHSSADIDRAVEAFAEVARELSIV